MLCIFERYQNKKCKLNADRLILTAHIQRNIGHLVINLSIADTIHLFSALHIFLKIGLAKDLRLHSNILNPRKRWTLNICSEEINPNMHECLVPQIDIRDIRVTDNSSLCLVENLHQINMGKNSDPE